MQFRLADCPAMSLLSKCEQVELGDQLNFDVTACAEARQLDNYVKILPKIMKCKERGRGGGPARKYKQLKICGERL